MGCKQITPQLVGQARRLEGKPFHLIATHAQDIESQKTVMARIAANGMSPFQPNLTITKNGVVPGVRTRVNKDGIRVMPYYFVFDHTGKLGEHGMGGSYHGGDGWTMFDIVDDLLAQTPVVYAGPEPFVHIEELADQAAKGKHLGDVAKKIDKALSQDPDGPTRAELERLQGALIRFRDRRLAYATSLEGSQPGRVLQALGSAAKQFKGTSLAPPAESKLATLRKSESLAAAVELEKKFRRIVKRFDSVKPKKRTRALIDKTAEKARTLLEGRQDLPFAQIVRTWINNLD